VLNDVGVVIHEWDRVTPEPDLTVQAGMTVFVQHARPVTVIADGLTRTVYTHSQSVDAILYESDVRLGPIDELWVDGQLFVDLLDGSTSAQPSRKVGGQAVDLGQSALDAGRLFRVASVHAVSSRGRRSTSVAPSLSIVEVQRAKHIYLNDDGVEQILRTTARTVGRALLEAQVRLYLGDRIYPSLNTPVTTGLNVRIQRGVPVSVVLDGRTIRTRTHRQTVNQVLAELGVSLAGKDFVLPSLDTEIQRDLSIRVVRVSESMIVEEAKIPFETEWLPDSSLELDHRRIDDVGSDGLKRRRYKVIYHDGQQVERYLEDKWIAKDPRSRKVSYGTRIVIRTLETPNGAIEYWRRLRVFLTSYTEATCGKTPDDPWYGLTRLGWKMRHGIIATDPRVIHLLSELYVPGYGRGVAADTGGMIRGRHIDLGYDVDNFIMHYKWGPSAKIRWILPDFPRER
jgi:uncharacterized protein YabE (DUF348 family)